MKLLSKIATYGTLYTENLLLQRLRRDRRNVSVRELFAPAEQHCLAVRVAARRTKTSAPAERYVDITHSTPLACGLLVIGFSIDIALHWRAVFFYEFRPYRKLGKKYIIP